MKNYLTILLICLTASVSRSQDLDPTKWPHLNGYWKFQNTKDLTKASVGNNLILVGKHQVVKGPALGDTAVRVPLGSYYKYKHIMAPNGGGDSVNRYTLMFDFKVNNFDRWHTFFQTDSANANDGECFIRPSTGSNPGCIGTATTGYTANPIKANVWYRLVISVNLNNFYRYYLNGSLVLEGDTQEVDGRFALLPQVLFFADNNNEDDTIDIASMAIFDTCLSSKDIALIGSIDPCVANPPRVNLGRDTSLCANLALSLNAGSNFTSYQWSTGNKLPFEFINANTLGIGKKQVWVKVIDRNGCVGGDTINIEYYPLANAQLGKDTSICNGQKVNLSVGANKSFIYQWKTLPKGRIISATNTFTADSTGTYAILIITPNGCFSSDTIQIQVNAKPLKPKINTVGATSFCLGDSVRLEGPGSYKDYFWSNGFSKQHQVLYASINLVLKVKDQFGCESPNSDTIKIVRFNLPPKPKIEVIGNLTFCDGDSVIFKTDSGYVQYNWQDGIGVAERVIKKPGIFYVRVVDSNKCVSPASEQVQVSILNAPPKPSISVTGKSLLCEGETTILNANSGHKGYLWTDSASNAKNTVLKQGSYRVKVRDNNGCYSPWSDVVFIEVTPRPVKPKVLTGTKDSLTCNYAAQKYKWFRNNVLIQDSMRSLKPMFSGFYQVQTSIKSCWSNSSDSFYFNSLKLEPLGSNNNIFIIYPNPVRDHLEIILDCAYCEGEVSVEVFNSLGQPVLKTVQIEIGSTNSIRLSAFSLPSGKYQIRIISKGKVYTGTFVKL